MSSRALDRGALGARRLSNSLRGCARGSCASKSSTLGRKHGPASLAGLAQVDQKQKKKKKNSPLARAGRLGRSAAAPTVAAAPRTAARREGAIGAPSTPATAATFTVRRVVLGRAAACVEKERGGTARRAVDRSVVLFATRGGTRGPGTPFLAHTTPLPGRPAPRCGWSACARWVRGVEKRETNEQKTNN